MELEYGELPPTESESEEDDGCPPRAYQFSKSERRRRTSSSSSSVSRKTYSEFEEEDRPMWKKKVAVKTKRKPRSRSRSLSPALPRHQRPDRRRVSRGTRRTRRNSDASSVDDYTAARSRSYRGDCSRRRGFRGTAARGRGYRGRYNSSRGSNRSSFNRAVSQPEKEENFIVESHACRECGKPYPSAKALAHHDIKTHGLIIDCSACSEKLKDIENFRKHFENEHPESRVVCVFCKSVFEKADEMSEKRWEFVSSHFYGETLYFKISQIEESKI